MYYRDGSIIKRNGSYYILKYIKGYGWNLFKIKVGKKYEVR